MASWTFAAASRRGAAHADAQTRRQDAYRIVTPPGRPRLLGAVACDGAGSTSHGGEGASIVAWTLGSAIRTHLVHRFGLPGRGDFSRWITLARMRIATAAARRGLEPSDFATTLVVAVTDGTTTVTAHVGDGAVACRCEATATWIALSWPEHGEYASTTFFVTDEGEPRLRYSRHGGAIDRLVVMTDGMERLALDFTAKGPHAPFFETMCTPLAARGVVGRNVLLCRDLGDYLDSDQVAARTDDDKTLILAAGVA